MKIPVVGFVPAAGSGYKVRALAGTHSDNLFPVPKLRLTTAGVPLAYSILRNFSKAGITRIDITHAEQPRVDSLVDYVKNHDRFRSLDVRFILERTPRGTAGSLADTLLRWGEFREDHVNVVVYFGDILSDLPLKNLLEAHNQTNALATIVVNPVPYRHIHRFGMVTIEGVPGQKTNETPGHYETRFEAYADREEGTSRRILQFEPKDQQERPHAGRIPSLFTDSSICVFHSSLLTDWLRDVCADKSTDSTLLMKKNIETDLFPYIFSRPAFADRFYAYVLPQKTYWRDLGTYSDIWLATMDAIDGTIRVPFTAQNQGHHKWIHPEARIDPSAVIRPPVVIDKGTVVGRDARIGPYVHLGEGWKVEPGAEIIGAYLSPARFYFQGDTLRTVGESARIIFSIVAGGAVPADSDVVGRVGYLRSSGRKSEFDCSTSLGADIALAMERISTKMPGTGRPIFSVEWPKEHL